MVPVGEKAVVRDLHCDRAETLTDSAGAEVPCDGSNDTTPVQPVVLIKTTIFRRDERRANVLRHHGDRDVDPSNILEVAEELRVPVVDVAALARMKSSNFSRARATIKAATGQPGVKREQADTGQHQQTEPWPLATDPAPSWVAGVSMKPLPEHRGAVAKEGGDHAGVVGHSIEGYDLGRSQDSGRRTAPTFSEKI